jgi:hypothetical protein
MNLTELRNGMVELAQTKAHKAATSAGDLELAAKLACSPLPAPEVTGGHALAAKLFALGMPPSKAKAFGEKVREIQTERAKLLEQAALLAANEASCWRRIAALAADPESAR